MIAYGQDSNNIFERWKTLKKLIMCSSAKRFGNSVRNNLELKEI